MYRTPPQFHFDSSQDSCSIFFSPHSFLFLCLNVFTFFLQINQLTQKPAIEDVEQPQGNLKPPITVQLISPPPSPTILAWSWVHREPQTRATVAIQASQRQTSTREQTNSKMTQRISAILYMNKGSKNIQESGYSPCLCLTIHDIWKTSAGRGQTFSTWGQKSQQE